MLRLDGVEDNCQGNDHPAWSSGLVMSRDRGVPEGLWEKLKVLRFEFVPLEKIQVGVF